MHIRNYVLRHFSYVYDVPEQVREDLERKKGKLWWPDSGLQFLQSDATFPADVELHTYKDQQLPFFFFGASNGLYEEVATGYRLNFDWISAAFYFLSGFQERHKAKADSRLFAKETMQYQHGVHRLPVVDYYFDLLRTLLEKAYQCTISFRADGATLLLSHDIDLLRSGWKGEGFHALKQGKLLYCAQVAFRKLGGRDPYDNLRKILDLEEAEGVQATYFFLARQGAGNADYDVLKKGPRRNIAAVLALGGEAGVHGALNACQDTAQLKAEIARVNVQVHGNRFHYLHFSPGHTPNVLHAAGLKYDASLGFFDEIGFRHGYCHPFELWSWRDNGPSGVVELPLHIMDTTFMNPNYLNIGIAQARPLVGEMMTEVRRWNGCLSILWHNNYFAPVKYKGWGEFYREIIRMAKKMDFDGLRHVDVAKAFLSKSVAHPNTQKSNTAP